MSTERARWPGTLHLGDDWLCFVGSIWPTEVHAHFATQLVLSDTEFDVHDEADGHERSRAALIGPNQAHRLTAHGQVSTALYLPLTRIDVGARASDWTAAGNQTGIDPVDLADDVASWVTAARDAIGARPLAPSGYVADAIEVARSALPGSVRLAEVARRVGISASALGHEFTRSVGVPWRQWLLAERIQLALTPLTEGGSLTAAAHAAGFADSAHFARTFRRMFGIAPSDVAGAVSWHRH